MKKNLCIVYCIVLCTQNLFAEKSDQLARVIEVVKSLKQAHVNQNRQKIMAMIKENLEQLSKPFDLPPVNAEIAQTRSNINNAVSKILQLKDQDNSKVDLTKIIPELIQDCYRLITKESIYPSMLSYTQKLQLTSFNVNPAEEKKLKLQMYDILNRIFVLWHLAQLIFNISNTQTFKLQWPEAELALSDWKKLTREAAQELWQKIAPQEINTAKNIEALANQERLVNQKRIETEMLELQEMEKIIQQKLHAEEQLLRSQLSSHAAKEHSKIQTNAKQRAKQQQIEQKLLEIPKEADQQYHEIIKSHLKEMENIIQSKAKAEENIKNKQEKLFANMQLSKQQLQQFNMILDLFLTELNSPDKELPHEIFTKYKFHENIGLAITYLNLIKQKLQNEEQLPKDKILQEIDALKKQFQTQINTIYSHYFKKEWAGRFGNYFLVIKHKFAPKEDGTIIPEVPEEDAVMLLTDVIILWELYNTLLPEESVTLNYLNQKFPVTKWIEETANAGFNQAGQFSEALKNSLTTVLPGEEIDYTGRMQLSRAFQNAKSGITTAGSAVKQTAQKTGSAIKEKAAATGGWFSSTWKSITNYATRKVEEEVDKL